jgi:hypothetical protein
VPGQPDTEHFNIKKIINKVTTGEDITDIINFLRPYGRGFKLRQPAVAPLRERENAVVASSFALTGEVLCWEA